MQTNSKPYSSRNTALRQTGHAYYIRHQRQFQHLHLLQKENSSYETQSNS